MSRSGLFATLAAGTAAVVGIGLLAKRRQQSRLPKNPSGIADANLSIAERREAAEEFRRLSKEQDGEPA